MSITIAQAKSDLEKWGNLKIKLENQASLNPTEKALLKIATAKVEYLTGRLRGRVK